MPHSIRARLAAALLFMAIIPLLVTGIIFAGMSYSSLRQQALSNQEAYALRIGTAVESFLGELAGQLTLLSRVHDSFSSTPSQEQKWLLDELLSYENRFHSISLIGPNGEELIRRNRRTIVLDKDLKNRAGDPAFQYPSASGKTYFGPVYTDPNSGEPLITIAIPLISSGSGQKVGALLAEARLKKIWDLLSSLPGDEGGSVFIVDDESNVIAHPDPSVVLRGTRFPLPNIAVGFAAGLEQESVALAVHRIELGAHPLHVVAQRPEAKVLSLAHDTLLAIALLLLTTVAVAAYLSILAVDHLVRPLRELAAAAEEIQKGNFSMRVACDRRQDEVGELAHSFNSMAEQLHHTLENMASEIDERKQAEARLKQHRATLRQILDTTPQAIFWKDKESVYLGCNRVFAEAIGLDDPEAVTGKTDFDLPWPREEAESYRADDHAVITSNQGKQHIIEPLQQADGSRLWIDTTKVPLVDEHGAVYGVLGVYADITEKRRAEEERQVLEMQLRQAQKMEAIGTLAGGIAHDFNNILSIIFGFTELAMIEEDAGKREEHLQEVYRASERARDLIRQILTFSRKMEQQRKPLQVSLIVKEALKMLRASIPTTVEIKQDIASEAMVLAEPTQIHQVVVNLCTNAAHAMQGNGVLAVSLHEVDLGDDDYEHVKLQAGRYLKLEVSDTGCGIDPAIREKIFEPYFTTKGLGEGTGMGLAVVHGIVKSHHGHITVYSETGKGTSFHIYLPVIEQAAAPSEPLGEHRVPGGNGERILFVDDEAQICAMATTLLTKNGYQIDTYTNPSEALAAFLKAPRRFDLLVTDMTMPHLTGAELAQQAMAIRPELPVILCTGQSALINEEKAMAMGIRQYLSKPLPNQTLLAAVHQTLADA